MSAHRRTATTPDSSQSHNVSRETSRDCEPNAAISPSWVASSTSTRFRISSLTPNVSRETSVTGDASHPTSNIQPLTSPPLRRRLPLLLATAALAAAAITAAACGAPPGPQGWAPARPVSVNTARTILVPHRAKLFALPDGSANPNWQFPPQDKNAFPISTDKRDRIVAAINALDIDAAAKTNLTRDVDNLAVGGESKNVLKAAIDASTAPQDAKNALKSQVDAATKFERSALDNLQALYGDVGVSPDGKTAYVPTFKGILFALDMSNGRTRWVRDAGGGFVGGVAVNGDTLYAGTKSRRIYAINASTGESIWTFNTKGEVWSTPTYDNGTLYATSLDGSTYAIDATSGQQKWIFDSAGSGIASHPVVSNGLVYVGAFDNKLYAINAADGTQTWSISGNNWFWSSPVVGNGVLYAASLDNKVYAVDASTGQKKWDQPFDTGAPIRSAPVLVDGSLIVASRDGKVYKIDPATGAADGDPIQPANKIQADLTADGSTVYINPDAAVLLTLDISSGPLQAPGSFPLPQ